MKLGDLINKLAVNSGTPADDAKLKIVLSSPTLIDQDIDDEIANAMLNNLLTEQSALANPKIKSAMFASALNPIDTTVADLIESNGLTEKWVKYRDEHVKKNPDGKFNTYDMIKKSNDFIVSEAKAAASGTMTADKKKLADDIEKLNADAVTLKTTYEQKIAEINQARALDRINWNNDTLFAGFNYAMEESHKTPKGTCVDIAKTIVEKKLNELGLKRVQDDTGNIALKNSADADHFEQNKKVAYNDFVAKVLTDNNLLKVTAKPAERKPGETIEVDKSKFNKGQHSASAALEAELASVTE